MTDKEKKELHYSLMFLSDEYLSVYKRFFLKTKKKKLALILTKDMFSAIFSSNSKQQDSMPQMLWNGFLNNGDWV